MSSPVRGDNTSPVEVTNISPHGIWLDVCNKEMFMSYDDFPWFKDQPIKNIFKVEEQSPGHYYWPELDVDLTNEMIEHPKKFPLKAK